MSRGKEELQPASYGLDFKCRAISPLPTPASHDKAAITHRFVIGTSSLKSNKIHLLEYDESQHLLECIAVWAHDSEIAQLSASNSTTKTMFSVLHYNNNPSSSSNTSSSSGGDNSEVQIFALEGADETTMSSQHTLPINASNVLWDPNGDLDSLVVVGTASGNPSVSIVKLAQSDAPAVSVNLSTACAAGGDIRAVHGAARDPHHKDLLAVCQDKSIGVVDLRGKKAGVAVVAAHQHAARSVDYNPNAMYRVVSSGDDNTLKVWDLRKASTNVGGSSDESSASSPLYVVHSLHDHPRINTVAYNPSHDELLLTSSIDHTARLWQFTDFSSSSNNKRLDSSTNSGGSASKILSAAPNAVSADSSKSSSSSSNPTSQYQLASLQDFGDSVYKSAWSFQSPWVYGACSYNGKVLIQKVDPLLQRQLMLQGAEE